MKSVITAVLILGLIMLSCKKDVQNDLSSNTDTLSMSDSMNTNSTAMPVDTIQNSGSNISSSGNDSMNNDTSDSTGTIRR